MISHTRDQCSTDSATAPSENIKKGVVIREDWLKEYLKEERSGDILVQWEGWREEYLEEERLGEILI